MLTNLTRWGTVMNKLHLLMISFCNLTLMAVWQWHLCCITRWFQTLPNVHNLLLLALNKTTIFHNFISATKTISPHISGCLKQTGVGYSGASFPFVYYILIRWYTNWSKHDAAHTTFIRYVDTRPALYSPKVNLAPFIRHLSIDIGAQKPSCISF